MKNDIHVFFTQEDLERINENLAMAVHHAAIAVEEAAAAFTALGKAAGIAIDIGAKYIAEVSAALFGTQDLRPVATSRQWYLLNHGSPKVRKKWRNALRRKLRIAEKRCNQ